MSVNRRRFLPFLTVLTASSASAAPDVSLSDAMALGGVGVAARRSNQAIVSNPGMLALASRYDFAGQFGLGPGGGLNWSASGVDARSNPDFALGFVYAGGRNEPPLRVDELPGWTPVDAEITNVKRDHHFILGSGVSLADRRVSIGLGGHYSLYNHDRHGQGGTGNVDVGLGFAPTPGLTLGLAGNNLIPLDPVGDRPLRVAGGARVDGKPGAIEVNGGVLPTSTDAIAPWFIGGGGELRASTARLRAGGRYDGRFDQPYVTAGLGFETEAGAIEYAASIPIGGGAWSSSHVIGLRFGMPPEPTAR